LALVKDGNFLKVFWNVATRSLTEIDRRFIALMMEAVSTSETLVNFCETTRRNIPEDSHLYTRRHENPDFSPWNFLTTSATISPWGLVCWSVG
jgi:hypothetical protein